MSNIHIRHFIPMDFHFSTYLSVDAPSTPRVTRKSNVEATCATCATSNVPRNEGEYLAMIVVITAWIIGV